ncbi:MAG TPA: transporter substrate-binding domain-containing protein, partial [Candidatus Limnocylindrales bacterium]|nr:transporter substrate-binding domain-containing protein [Candidatus Limnocylindrales bacterium]
AVFNDNAAAVSALKNKQIDGLVVDLPTAFYLVAAEIDEGVIVGQLPAAEGTTTDQFGILLPNNSALTQCTTQAVDELRAEGTLDTLEATWLGSDAGAPTLQ